jgi:hypothetical protein
MGRVGSETSFFRRVPTFVSTHRSEGLRLFEVALVLVRFDHITSGIVNANHSIM